MLAEVSVKVLMKYWQYFLKKVLVEVLIYFSNEVSILAKLSKRIVNNPDSKDSIDSMQTLRRFIHH